MRYCVSVNTEQEKQQKDLEEARDGATREKDDLYETITGFVSEIRANHQDVIEKPHIYPILDCIKQISFSFKEFKKAKSHGGESMNEAEDNELAMVLVFFLNAKAFLELIKKYTNYKVDKDLFRDTKKIRDFLVHFYEKENEQEKFFVSLIITRGLGDISELEAKNVDTGLVENQIRFSLDLFYFAIRDIFKSLKDSPQLLK
jgi:hypothetical protein